MLFCKAFLGDLTPKGEKCGSKQVSPKGEEMSSNGGEIWGEEKRENQGFRGRPSRHWMVGSIQVSVSVTASLGPQVSNESDKPTGMSQCVGLRLRMKFDLV